MDSYEDYLYACSLKDLKREAEEFKLLENKDRKIGTLILKLIAKKLPKSIGGSIKLPKFDENRYLEMAHEASFKGV